jgi:hypothetical protein
MSRVIELSPDNIVASNASHGMRTVLLVHVLVLVLVLVLALVLVLVLVLVFLFLRPNLRTKGNVALRVSNEYR